MSKFINFLIFNFCLIINTSVLAGNSPCVHKVTTVKELVKEAKSIYRGRASSFTKAKHPVYSGYYTFHTSERYKYDPIYGTAGPPGDTIVWGLEPYTEIRQSDIDITLFHNTWTSELRGSGSAVITIHEGKCYLTPKFKLGWYYLIVTGVESVYSYELIHSPLYDNWFQMIFNEAVKPLN